LQSLDVSGRHGGISGGNNLSPPLLLSPDCVVLADELDELDASTAVLF
jgi:hypothetical protein